MIKVVKLVMVSLLSLCMILATAAAALAEDQVLQPGVLSKVKGKIEVTVPDTSARMNPNRPSRIIEYNYGPRLAYRSGDLEYYNRRKTNLEATKPAQGTKVQYITGTKRETFVKNAPDMHPYVSISRLKQTIDTTTYQWGSKYKYVQPLDKSVSSTKGGE